MIEEMSDDEMELFLTQQRVGRIGCHVADLTYVVPVIYAWDRGNVYVYTTEGQKIEMMRQNAHVCFEVDEYLASGSWRSVIVQGEFEELDADGAAETLRLLTARVSAGSAARRTDDRGSGRPPVALRIRASSMTGRRVDRS